MDLLSLSPRRGAHLLSLLTCLWLAASCAGTSAGETDRAAVQDARGLVAADLDGARHSVDEELAAGRAVALVFWQPWCGSCLDEAPRVEQARRELAGRVTIFGVVSGPDGSVDEADIRRIDLQLGLGYPHLRDRDGSWSSRFAVRATPTIIVLEPGGSVVHRGAHLPEDWGALLGG
jgi:thiol-disulfide isomerase/thioredoxin